MNSMLRPAPLAAALALVLAFSPVAETQAQDWFVRAGVTVVDPKDDNGRLAGGALESSVDSNTQLGLTVGYHFTPNIAVELLASTKFDHTVSVNGAKAVDVSHLPPTLSLQYYFMPESKVNPFLGLGINYTWLHDEDARGPLAGADVAVDNSWGVAFQGGVVVKLTERFELIGDIRWVDIGSNVYVNGANVGKVNIDPLVYSLMLGYRF